MAKQTAKVEVKWDEIPDHVNNVWVKGSDVFYQVQKGAEKVTRPGYVEPEKGVKAAE